MDKYLNKIIQGDCLEVMKTMRDKSIDLILTDPPYGLGIDGQKQSYATNPKHDRKKHEFKDWDNEIPSEDYFREMVRVSKNQIIFGGNYFVKYFNEGHKGWIVWDKGQRGLTMSDGELAYSSFDKPLRIYTINRVEILKDGASHPTMKPLLLFKNILRDFSQEGNIVFDPFLGSGTTAVACKSMARHYIGVEIDSDYYKIAEDRLRQEVLL